MNTSVDNLVRQYITKEYCLACVVKKLHEKHNYTVQQIANVLGLEGKKGADKVRHHVRKLTDPKYWLKETKKNFSEMNEEERLRNIIE